MENPSLDERALLALALDVSVEFEDEGDDCEDDEWGFSGFAFAIVLDVPLLITGVPVAEEVCTGSGLLGSVNESTFFAGTTTLGGLAELK